MFMSSYNFTFKGTGHVVNPRSGDHRPYRHGNLTFPHAVGMIRAKLGLLQKELDETLPALALKYGISNL